MAILVTDRGFQSDDWTGCYATPDAPVANAAGLDLPSDTRAEDVALDGVKMIRIDFPSFADGRGFSIARALRRLGYKGRLRAKGHVIADQYTMARRAGFDEVEIDDDLAARQPEDQWLARANWQDHDYRARLRG